MDPLEHSNWFTSVRPRYLRACSNPLGGFVAQASTRRSGIWFLTWAKYIVNRFYTAFDSVLDSAGAACLSSPRPQQQVGINFHGVSVDAGGAMPWIWLNCDSACERAGVPVRQAPSGRHLWREFSIDHVLAFNDTDFLKGKPSLRPCHVGAPPESFDCSRAGCPSLAAWDAAHRPSCSSCRRVSGRASQWSSAGFSSSAFGFWGAG